MGASARQRRSTAPDSRADRERLRRGSAFESSLEAVGVQLGGAVASSGIGASVLHSTTYSSWPSYPWEADAVQQRPRPPSQDGDGFRRDWDVDTLARLAKVKAAAAAAETAEPDLPVWWITFQMSWWAPQWITGGLLVGILIPFKLLDIVGEERKSHALALVTVMNTCVNLCGPLFGGASDAMPYTSVGRRRPFIVVGMLAVAMGIYVMCYAHSYGLFFAGWALFCVGNNCAQPAYSCLLPELIPNQQRGLASGIFVFFQVFGALISSGLGLLVGQSTISDDVAYWILIGLALYSAVAGCIGMGKRPGLWSPERPPLDEKKTDAGEVTEPLLGAAATEAAVDVYVEATPATGDDDQAVTAADAHSALPALPAPIRKLLSFFTAFEFPNFRWLFIYIFIWSSSGQFGGLFKAYWMADVIGPDCANTPHRHHNVISTTVSRRLLVFADDFFGYEIAKCSVVPPEELEACTSSGAQSALSIMNGMNQ